MSGNMRLGQKYDLEEVWGFPYVSIPAVNDDRHHGKCGRTRTWVKSQWQLHPKPGQFSEAINSGGFGSPKRDQFGCDWRT